MSESRKYYPAFIALTLSVASLTALVVPASAQDQPAPQVTISGVLEANYTLNFNRPANGSNTYLYNTKEGQLALNLADLRISKTATPTSRTGFLLRLIEGEVRQRNFIAGEANPADPFELPYVLEAYGTYLAPLGGRDIKVDVGQFVTHVGYETIDIGTNNFVSRNFLFQFPSPFYNQGIRASYSLGRNTTVTGFLLNRYNGANDTGNRDIAPGFQIVQTLSPRSSVVLNGLTSRENLDYIGYGPGASVDNTPFPEMNNKQQSVLDVVYSNQFSDSFKVVAEGLHRFGKNASDESYSVTGGALYGIYTFKNGNVAAIRGEYLSASKANNPVFPTYPVGADSDSKQNLGSVTASYELKTGVFPGMRTFFEYRYDFAGKPFFPGRNVTTDENGFRNISDYKRNQSTFTIGQVFTF